MQEKTEIAHAHEFIIPHDHMPEECKHCGKSKQELYDLLVDRVSELESEVEELREKLQDKEFEEMGYIRKKSWN